MPYRRSDKHNADEVDADGAIRNLSCIKGNELSILFREAKEGKIKISFRSTGKLDVLDLSRSFNGGGHKLAAGSTMFGSLEDIKKQVLEASIKELEKQHLK